MPYGKWEGCSVCVCVLELSVRLCGPQGHIRFMGGLTCSQRLPTPSVCSMNTWGQARLNGRAEAMEKSTLVGERGGGGGLMGL